VPLEHVACDVVQTHLRPPLSLRLRIFCKRQSIERLFVTEAGAIEDMSAPRALG
jgi:hypothetical protein